MEVEPDWENLPWELLIKFEKAGAGPNLRSTCKTWKTNLEANTTVLRIFWSEVPEDLPVRFPSLAILDLKHCDHPITPEILRGLGGLPLQTLAVTLTSELLLSDELITCLSDLSPAMVDMRLVSIPPLTSKVLQVGGLTWW